MDTIKGWAVVDPQSEDRLSGAILFDTIEEALTHAGKELKEGRDITILAMVLEIR